MAEGYSDSVATLLAEHWQNVGELARLVRKDPMFGRFVLYHVDETMEMEQGKAIIFNARNRCPSGMERFCRHLEKAATFHQIKRSNDIKVPPVIHEKRIAGFIFWLR